ncbi:MAG: PAS domain S-box protein [Spirochaetota bacterium]
MERNLAGSDSSAEAVGRSDALGRENEALRQDIGRISTGEETLRQSEGMYKAILKSAMDGFWLVDTQGRIVEVNETYCGISGYTAEELLSMYVSDLDLLDDPDRVALRIGEIAEHGSARFETRHRHKDGRSLDIEISIQYCSDRGGIFACFIRDTTELHRIQSQHLENEKRLRMAQEYANIGVWEWDLLSNSVYWSERIWIILGHPEHDITPSREAYFAAIHPDDRRTLIDSISRSFETGKPFETEYRSVWSDGSVHWLLGNGNVVFDQEGRPARLLGLVKENTERKLAELALVESREEARRANRAKSEFLSSMSHELRTPMNSILGFGQLLEMDRGLSPNQSDFVREIMKASRHLLELINEVLDLSRIESGTTEVTIETIDCDGLVQECRKLVETIAAKRGIGISVRGRAALAMRADRLRLKQVIVNLLSNAIKYNSEMGFAEMRLSASEGWVRLEVADRGPGIPEERMKELFEPFSRLGAENGTIEGAGIGLSISKRLVELMGGRIGALSERGAGSIFWVELPEAGAHSAEAVACSAEVPRGGSENP